LVLADVNGVSDIYEWEANGTGSCNRSDQNGGCLFLVSPGNSPLPASLADVSVDGDNVFFFTAQSLVRQDRDELLDVYDARVGGGILSQNEVEPAPCASEGCTTGAGTVAPNHTNPGSTVRGPGNSKPLQCKKGFHKVTKKGHESCVKNKKKHGQHKKKAKHKKRAGGNSTRRLGAGNGRSAHR
jgi:hypothetical protein